MDCWGLEDSTPATRRAAEDKVHVHDLHATILHLLGFDHKLLTFPHNGREERLTDVAGHIGQPFFPSVVWECQELMVEAQQVQDRGVQVVYVDFVFCGAAGGWGRVFEPPAIHDWGLEDSTPATP